MLALLLLACAPKLPPEGSTELALGMRGTDNPVVEVELSAADAPVPPGAGRPWEGEPKTAGQRAFVEGEALLSQIESLPEPTGAVESSQRATRASELAEAALAQFALAAEEPNLRAPSTCRAGDAWRLAADAMQELQPPPHSDPAAEESARTERDASVRELEENALQAYGRVLADRGAEAEWLSHARWGVAELELR